MRPRILSGILFCFASIFVSDAVLACEVAGPNKHVGQVTAVDGAASTFTITDAETRMPITFRASKAILKDISGAQGQVMVSYEEKGSELVAVDVHF